MATKKQPIEETEPRDPGLEPDPTVRDDMDPHPDIEDEPDDDDLGVDVI